MRAKYTKKLFIVKKTISSTFTNTGIKKNAFNFEVMGDNRHIKEGTLFMPYLGIFSHWQDE